MKIIAKIIIALILIAICFYIGRIWIVKKSAERSRDQILSQLTEAQKALKDLSLGQAKDPLTDIHSEIGDFKKELEKFGLLSIAGLWNKELPEIVNDVSHISEIALYINEDLDYLKKNAAALLLEGPGEKLIERLEAIYNKLHRLSSYRRLGARAQSELIQIQKGVAALTELISQPNDKPARLLVMFQNESELRPAGGFLGSYADITIAEGVIQKIDVRDIYDPDGQLDIKVIPPAPLQRITKDWEARDANWFFDFPASAAQVISFLEQSKIYSEQKANFVGAVAINTKVLADLFEYTGPISLPEYKLTLTKDTFLPLIQAEVEMGPHKAYNQPKKILQSLAPIMLSKIKEDKSEKILSLTELLKTHVEQKNIMIYAEDVTLLSLLKNYQLGGAVTPTTYTTSTIGDYLGVVSANLAGGKSDYVTRQEALLTVDILPEGSINHILEIKRTHSGEHEKDWWYRAPHKTYTQIYLPLGSRLDDASGTLSLPKPAGWDYTGYQQDPLVSRIEETTRVFTEQNLERFIAFGKTVFAGWITTPPGGSRNFKMSYKTPKRFDDLTNRYELIIDKQSGAHSSLNVVINAPDGYIWKETKSKILSYQNSDPPGQLKIIGTLINY